MTQNTKKTRHRANQRQLKRKKRKEATGNYRFFRPNGNRNFVRTVHMQTINC